MEFTNEDELRMLRTGPTSISKSQRSQSAFLFRRCFGDLGTRQEMENRKSVMVASVPQGVVWDLALVFNSGSYTSCLSPGDGPHSGHSDERENAETPVSRPAGTEVWVMPGTVQSDLQHSERDLQGQRDAGSNPNCLIKGCCVVSIQGEATHILKGKGKQLWVMV